MALTINLDAVHSGAVFLQTQIVDKLFRLSLDVMHAIMI
jgi:hypothetical protein